MVSALRIAQDAGLVIIGGTGGYTGYRVVRCFLWMFCLPGGAI